MKTLPYKKVVSAIRQMCIEAACNLPNDVLSKIKDAYREEPFPRAKMILEQLITNCQIGSSSNIPICQDTGFAVFFVSMGTDVCISDDKTIIEAINEGTRQGYKDGFLRASIVSDPLFSRTNTFDNTPALVHVEPVKGDTCTITLLPKGGGCENMSFLRMLKPSDGKDGVVKFVTDSVIDSGGNPCPPVIVGVGIGGTSDKAANLAKKALLREAGSLNPDPLYAKLEKEILTTINQSGVGPLGLGGKTTALAVHIEHFPCHIASLPVAVSLNCHSARKTVISL
ncbi:fumarate hydratase [Chitinispirillales bacterium ANBcel5]|uniref:fumarate hydratase n=1 Tax=Cellulosispirillum alkaliphilum TaxID=3039283 RepID=UPI002A54B61D|nr:fumarate hydratase [Chitinispirillales bacterium ANBcel5]